jgi:hypothetical protein
MQPHHRRLPGCFCAAIWPVLLELCLWGGALSEPRVKKLPKASLSAVSVQKSSAPPHFFHGCTGHSGVDHPHHYWRHGEVGSVCQGGSMGSIICARILTIPASAFPAAIACRASHALFLSNRNSPNSSRVPTASRLRFIGISCGLLQLDIQRSAEH